MSYNAIDYIFLRTVQCCKTAVVGRYYVKGMFWYEDKYIDLFIPNFLKKRILGKHHYKPYGRVKK